MLASLDVPLPCDLPDDCASSARKKLATSSQFPYTTALLQRGLKVRTIEELKAEYHLRVAEAEDVMEVFCPPRIVPAARARGLTGSLSIDILTGFNLTDARTQEFVCNLVRRRRPSVVLVSPPCTTFSKLQNMNAGRVPEAVMALRCAEGNTLLAFAMEICRIQLSGKPCRGFIFEHPAGASSWATDVVRNLSQQESVHLARFDQCRFGLKSPSGNYMRKSTVLMTNINAIMYTFDGKRCLGDHEHQVIQGSEHSVKVSAFASVYPDGLVDGIVDRLVKPIHVVCSRVGE